MTKVISYNDLGEYSTRVGTIGKTGRENLSTFSAAFSSCEIPNINSAAQNVISCLSAISTNWSNFSKVIRNYMTNLYAIEHGFIDPSKAVGLNQEFTSQFVYGKWDLPDFRGEKVGYTTPSTINIDTTGKFVGKVDLTKIAVSMANAKSGIFVSNVSKTAFQDVILEEHGEVYKILDKNRNPIGWTPIDSVPRGESSDKGIIKKYPSGIAATEMEKAMRTEQEKNILKRAEKAKEEVKNAQLPGNQVISEAKKYLGNPYVFGGSSLTHGTDCSGFVMRIYEKFGYSLPHSSSAMRSCGKPVDGLANAQPGDIICYDGHVALYMGNGEIIAASNAKDGIKIGHNANYRKIVSIRRMV